MPVPVRPLSLLFQRTWTGSAIWPVASKSKHLISPPDFAVEVFDFALKLPYAPVLLIHFRRQAITERQQGIELNLQDSIWSSAHNLFQYSEAGRLRSPSYQIANFSLRLYKTQANPPSESWFYEELTYAPLSLSEWLF
jgi:hypothetical protein